MTAEQLANAILNAAGSDLRYYMPHNRAAIIEAAEKAIREIKGEKNER